MTAMPPSHAFGRAFGYDNAAIIWRQAAPRRRQPAAFWKTATVRMMLASVGDQRARRRACAVPQREIHAWVVSLVQQTWPERSERARIAAELAPEVPFWWLGPEETDRLIANAVLKKSRRVHHGAVSRRTGVARAVCPAWAACPGGAADAAGAYASAAT